VTLDRGAAEGDPFAWHPEPELIDILDEARSRPALERLGDEAWSTALDYVYREALRRAMGDPAGYATLRERFFGPSLGPGRAPSSPTPSAELLAEFRERLAPYQLNAWHPRTLSYFTPAPLVLSIVGELLAQVAHQGVDVWHAGPSAAFVEEEVVRWLCDLVGYGDGSFGILTSGGVMANFLALALARDIHLRRLLRADRPPRGGQLEGCRIYVSDQAHFSVARAVDELGFGADTLVVVPSDERFRLQAGPVAEAIAADRAAGRRPLAIAAVAGATNTGSVDDVPALAQVATREGLWFHVDAAYGGAARLSARDTGRVPGLELADSVTIDPHKWFFQAYDVGALVIRDGGLLEATFSRRPEYYRGGGATAQAHDAHTSDGLDFYRLGFEGTRRWRALKLWLSWKHLGTEGFGRLIERTNDLAATLTRRCLASDDFDIALPEPELSVVCFRHLPGGRQAARALPAGDLDDHQDRLQAALEASGEGWLSTTRLRGVTWLRAGFLNPMTREADLDGLLASLRRLAAEV
jgi:aromatic-L-amino-acid decarboxylase